MADRVTLSGICRKCGATFRREVISGGGWTWRCPECRERQPGPAALRAEAAEAARLREGINRRYERAKLRRKLGLPPRAPA